MFEFVFLFLLFFGGLIYGFFSKKPLLSFLLGFSFYFLYLAVGQITMVSWENIDDDYLRSFLIAFIFSCLNGISGFLAAKTFDGEKVRYLVIISAVFLSIALSLLFFSGLN